MSTKRLRRVGLVFVLLVAPATVGFTCGEQMTVVCDPARGPLGASAEGSAEGSTFCYGGQKCVQPAPDARFECCERDGGCEGDAATRD